MFYVLFFPSLRLIKRNQRMEPLFHTSFGVKEYKDHRVLGERKVIVGCELERPSSCIVYISPLLLAVSLSLLFCMARVEENRLSL